MYQFSSKNYFGTNNLSGSTRILASPSRGPLLCFLSVGLARKAHESKKVLQGWSKAKRMEIFEQVSQKYDPFLAEVLAPYIESEKGKLRVCPGKPQNVRFDLVGVSYNLYKYLPLFFAKISGIFVVATLDFL